MKRMDYNFNKNRMQPTKSSGPSVATLPGQPGQVSSGPAKRSLAMEIPEYDLPTLEGVYKQLYAYGNYIDEVVYASCPGATYTMRRYLHDHLYSPAAIVYLTAGNCIVVERSEYDAYGVAHYYNADYTQTFAVSQHGNPFAFTGREIDSFNFASGVPQLTQMHYRHRDYSPFMGRFYQQDPLGVNPAGGLRNPFSIIKQYSDGLNLYEYIKSQVIIYKDPVGLLRLGGAQCDPMTPQNQDPVKITLSPLVTDPDVKQCILEHEQKHKKQLQSCCERFRLCVRYAGGASGQSEFDCYFNWSNWFEYNTDDAECAAYKTSFRCYNRLLDKYKCYTCPTNKAKCQMLLEYAESDKAAMDQYCNGKSETTSCPFNASGGIGCRNPHGPNDSWF